MKRVRFVLLILFLTASFACESKSVVEKPDNQDNSQPSIESQPSVTNQPTVAPPEDLVKAMKAVEPFFRPMGEPTGDEWLANFKEDGQTFAQYIGGNPVLPSPERKTLYIQPLGEFSETQLKIIRLTVEYTREFFGLPVKLLAPKKFKEPLSLKNQRMNQFTKSRQIRTDFILEEVLKPNLPKDAAALIAFTNEDLFPDSKIRYVFGQASLKDRIGVWSLFRLDDFANYEKFLRRTLKVAVHETGHMFSFAHCTKYECVMSGTNHLSETDKRPIDVCPECMAKICWMSDYEPKKRYEKLAEFCKTRALKNDYEEFNRKAAAVSKD